MLRRLPPVWSRTSRDSSCIEGLGSVAGSGATTTTPSGPIVGSATGNCRQRQPLPTRRSVPRFGWAPDRHFRQTAKSLNYRLTPTAAGGAVRNSIKAHYEELPRSETNHDQSGAQTGRSSLRVRRDLSIETKHANGFAPKLYILLGFRLDGRKRRVH